MNKGLNIDIQVHEIVNKFHKQFSENMNLINKQIEPIRRNFNEAISKIDFDQIKSLPKRRKEHLLKLGEDGWCIDLNMSVEKSLIENEDYEEYFINHFENNIDNISSFIKNKYPARKQIIHKAFKAHVNEDYELSIPVILTQIDGICFDNTNESIFIKHNYSPNTSSYVENLPNELRKAWFAPLAEELPISYSSKKRSNAQIDFTLQLNRHLVLHGESTDYPTRINSLKAISFLNYIAQLFELEKKK